MPALTSYSKDQIIELFVLEAKMHAETGRKLRAEIDKLRRELELTRRKADHGCHNFHCPDCDPPPSATRPTRGADRRAMLDNPSTRRRTVKLEYRHNNAYDSIVLVNDEGQVRSDWTVGPDELRDFCDCSQDAADWDDRGGNEHTPDQYGELIAVRWAHGLDVKDVDAWESRVNYILH